MGSFDLSCAITGVSVSSGDEVLQVVYFTHNHFNRFEEAFYDVSNSIDRYGVHPDFEELTEQVEFTLKRLEKILGQAPELPEPKIKTPIERLQGEGILARWGIYNDYGWIENEERPPYEKKYLQFMVHRDVALKIAERDGKDPNDLHTVLKAVTDFIYICRINPWWCLSGLQSWEKMEYDFHKTRAALIAEMIEKKRKWWEEE